MSYAHDFVRRFGSSLGKLEDNLCSYGVRIGQARDGVGLAVTYLSKDVKPMQTNELYLSGLILDTANPTEIKIVGAFPPEFNRNPSLLHLMQHIDEYEVSHVHFGTVVALYYSAREMTWRLATRRTATGATFRETSVEDVFGAAAMERGLTATGTLNEIGANLNHDYTYSFIVYSRELQEFEIVPSAGRDYHELWFVCSRNNNTMETNWVAPPELAPTGRMQKVEVAATELVETSAAGGVVEKSLADVLLEKLSSVTMSAFAANREIIREKGMGLVFRRRVQSCSRSDDPARLYDNIIMKNDVYKRVDELVGNVQNIQAHMPVITQSDRAIQDFCVLFPPRAQLCRKYQATREIMRKFAHAVGKTYVERCSAARHSVVCLNETEIAAVGEIVRAELPNHVVGSPAVYATLSGFAFELFDGGDEPPPVDEWLAAQEHFQAIHAICGELIEVMPAPSE